ncbi:MAG: hypothetical protein IKW31_06510 [Alistipes sp.]|nr:hypothetical protein [Alistipes sp.]
MRHLFTKLWYLVAAMVLVAACTTSKDEPTPDAPTPTEKVDFAVEIGNVTRATVTFSVTPSSEIGDYICVVEERSVVEQYTQDKFVIATVFQELTEKASSKGLTLAEYMPSVVDNGKIEDVTFTALQLDTEYYVLVFGVDENYEACTELTKVAFKTLAVEKSDCSFEIATDVVDNSVTITVAPSDQELLWYLCTMPKSTYDYYVSDANGYQMSEGYFYEYFFQQDINSYRGAGYTDEQIIAALIHQGNQQLQASGLNENTEYYILVAGLIMDSEGIVICTDINKASYTTQNAAQSTMTFEIDVWDIGQMEASFRITPSNNNDLYCALVQPWDGVSTADEVMHQIVDQWGGWMSIMADDKGVVEHSGSKAMKLPAADTDYYIIAFGYDGGITTDAYMKTFRTLPGGSVEEVEFTITASNISPYGFNMNISSSDPTIYYIPGACVPSEYDEETYIAWEEEAFDYYYAGSKDFNPSITIAEVLDQYYYNGSSNVMVSGLLPDTEIMAYIYALDVHTGHVVKSFTFDNVARTETLGEATPTVEIVGYYSGDEEAGSIFGNAAISKGKAIIVVKYTDLDNTRTLFTSMLEGDCSNPMAYSDGELWTLASSYWSTCKTSQPYSFYTSEWNADMTALAYCVDNSGKVGALGRRYACATAENKSDIEELRTLVNELNSDTRASDLTLELPRSLVVNV